MIKLRKGIIVFALSLAILVQGKPVYASTIPVQSIASKPEKVNLTIDDTEYIDASSEQPISVKSDGYYYWKVTSKTITGHPYGSWRNGPSGRGKATLTLSNSLGNSYNFGVTNTITGTYTNVGAIASALNVSIGVSINYEASYAVAVPKNKRYQIIFRPQFTKYKVIQKQYHKMDGYSTATGKTKTAYVNVFSNWDYSWKELPY